MSDKFKDKYRISSSRLNGWDYGSSGAYFVTICTRKMTHHFGEIKKATMYQNEVGKINEKFWFEIPNHFEFIKLDAFVVMPNHIHGILIFEKKKLNIENCFENEKEYPETPESGVSTDEKIEESDSEMAKCTNGGKNLKWKPGTLGVVINQYKRICTINARKIHPDFEWQPRFFDHIIRSDIDFQRIKNYIIENPKNWDNDDYNLT
jgi:REP element-mobilizing transposase RayT